MNYDHVHVDFETRSTIDLRKAGADVYAKDDTTSALCMAYSYDDEHTHLWRSHDEFPQHLIDFIAEGGKLVGHNAGGFEILIWNHVLSKVVPDLPELKIEQVEDTMAMAFAMSLPGSLDDASKALGMEVQKDMAGKRVMLQLARPRSIGPDGKPIWWDGAENRDKYEILWNYCVQDVEVERELYKRLLKLSESETKLWRRDWKINRRGVYVDKYAAEQAMQIVDLNKDHLDWEMRKITDDKVYTASAVSQLKDWLNDQLPGLNLDSLSRDVIERLLPTLHPSDPGHKALKIRQAASKTSTSKIKAMIQGLDDTGRMCGLFQYHGANTGRWAGRRVQLQNLKRPTMSQPEIERVFDVLNERHWSVEDKLKEIKALFGDPTEVLSNCLRGFIKAKPGNTLIGCDLSAIEARVLAWLAGQNNILEIFKKDGKIYEHAAGIIFGKAPEDVTKEERQIGKVAVLALGYGGGVGAFQQMAKAYGVEVGDKRAEEIKVKWREGNDRIVAYWAALEKNAIRAVARPGTTTYVEVEHENGGACVRYKQSGSFLFCKLPSGRVICYPYPKIIQKEVPWGGTRATLTYMGQNTFTRKWERIDTYGGKLAENVTQAVSRCVLSDFMMSINEDSGAKIIMHVHDEVVLEGNFKERHLFAIEEKMSQSPEWAPDLPLAAEGWIGERYRK
jgi:DNA polymerase bacteriophage-type